MANYFSAQSIYHNGRLWNECALAVDEEGQVLGLLPRSYAKAANTKDYTDFGQRILCPGWVDLQVNGCGGGLFNRDLSLDCLEKMLRSSLRHGATSIQPTLITCPDEDILNALNIVGKAIKSAGGGRQKRAFAQRQLWQGIIGMHLEGPYISHIRRGAHSDRWIRPLDEVMLQKLLLASRSGILSYITVASEAVQPEQVARLAASGLTVALGHSGASFWESRALLLAGARCFTHLYNGMGDISAREPHMLSLALGDRNAHSSIIADGHHVAAENLRIAHHMLKERLFLVTDATATADGGEESVFFGEQTCCIKDGLILNEQGVLAGSALTMQRGVEVLCGLFGMETALAMACEYPVQALSPLGQYGRHIGSFAPGTKANFLVLEFSDGPRQKEGVPAEIASLETWVLGQRWEG